MSLWSGFSRGSAWRVLRALTGGRVRSSRWRQAIDRFVPADPSSLAVLHQCGLFDEAWYRDAYPDIASDGRDLCADYLEAGSRGVRDPNAVFRSAWYLATYPDVRDAGVNPLVHFVRTGALEQRDPGPDFETTHYLALYPEVAASGMNPLLHYLRHGRTEGRSPRPQTRNAMDLYEAALKHRRGVAGAALLDHVHFPLHPPTRVAATDGRALPPLDLARRIGAPDLGEFEWIGRGTREAIIRCLPPGFDFRGARVLDFGCGVGRVLRYFSEDAKAAEIWGCDIDGPSIRWCVENLSPPFRFFQISETPTIPLESNSLDLIYAISVFAHIHVDWHHWMAEVRRVLKPGGVFFVTFMAQTPFEEMLRLPFVGQGADFGKYVKNPFADWNDGGPMAFHNPEWIKAYWGNLFDIDFIALEGLLEYQSICLMRKPAPGAPIRTDGPVLKYSAAQAFNPDAVGWIHEAYDASKPFRESYGIEAPHGVGIEARGWIVLRADRPVRVEAQIDGDVVDSDIAFEARLPYRDWAETTQFTFVARVGTVNVGPGPHRLTLAFTGERGVSHAVSIPLVIC